LAPQRASGPIRYLGAGFGILASVTYTTSRTIGTELRRTLRGAVWEFGDDGYDDARTIWNGAVDHRPAVVARCADARDVQRALLAARSHGLPVSVRGGGHDWGRAGDSRVRRGDRPVGAARRTH